MKQLLDLLMTSSRISVVVLSFLLLSACLDSTSDSGNGTNSDTVVTSSFSGSVGDGPVVAATVNIYDKNGNLVSSVTSDNTAKYSAKVKAKGSVYPLTIEVEGGTDLVTQLDLDFRMASYISHPSSKNININPFSTMIVKMARIMPGGLNDGNIEAASKIVQEKLNFGLDPAVVANTITTALNDDNTAVFIKSSEAMGEMIRRTRDHLMAIGVVATADDVIAAIAHDIADGRLDGLGGSMASSKVAVVSKLTSAQVLIEVLSNNLRVGDTIATDRMDSAVTATRPSVPLSLMTDSILINQELLVQARDTIKVAQMLAPSAEVDTIAATLDLLRAGSLASEVETVLPADASDALDQSVSIAVSATDEQLVAAINGDTGNILSDPPVDLPVANSAPLLSGTPATTVLEDSAYLYQPSATDTDGDTLSFSIQNRPGWATFNTSTGRLNGTPRNAQVGTYSNIVVTVSDGNLSDTVGPFSITVKNSNDAPSISGSAASSATAGGFYSFQPSASDPDGDDLTFSIVKRPSWASFNTGTGRLSGTPANGDAGIHDGIVISASDSTVTRSLPPFAITVSASTPSNQTPVISGTPATSVAEDSAYLFQPTASDADGDNLTFSISNRPSWAAFNGTTGRLSGTPGNGDVRTYSDVNITVSDGTASASTGSFSITVTNTNDTPVISGSPAPSVDEGSAYSFQPTASDPDGDSLTFSILNRPAWATFNTGTGRLAGTPASGDAGIYNDILISVTDGVKTVNLAPFRVTVNSTTTGTGSASLSWIAPATRADGDALGLSEIAGYTIYYGESVGSYPNSLQINGVSSTSITITDMPFGTYYFVVTTRDTLGKESALSDMVTAVVN